MGHRKLLEALRQPPFEGWTEILGVRYTVRVTKTDAGGGRSLGMRTLVRLQASNGHLQRPYALIFDAKSAEIVVM